jgi:hypothetical protein
MVRGRPAPVRALVGRAFTGVDGQTSVLLGFSCGAQAVLTFNFFGDGPTRAVIVGTEARIEVDAPFYALAPFTLTNNGGTSVRYEPADRRNGLRYEADEV